MRETERHAGGAVVKTEAGAPVSSVAARHHHPEGRVAASICGCLCVRSAGPLTERPAVSQQELVGSAFGPSVVFPGIVEAQARAAWRHIILTWLVMMFAALLLALDHDNRMMTQGRKGARGTMV